MGKNLSNEEPSCHRLSGKVALITGAGRGIGRAIAYRLGKEGASLVINDYDQDVIDDTSSLLTKEGVTQIGLRGDVTRLNDVQNLISAAINKYGRLDILVNNAGIFDNELIHRMTDDQFRKVLDVNLMGTFFCIREAAPYLRDVGKNDLSQGISDHRKVINITSIAGIRGGVAMTNYSAAKAAVIGLTKALAREWAPFRVNVNAVAPGFIETRLTSVKEEGGIGIRKEIREKTIKEIPMGRGGKPEDISGVVAFLASSDADYMTGQILEVHGGLEVIV